jgi:hypothetical protein
VIRLNPNTSKLQAKLAATVATNQCDIVASYNDRTITGENYFTGTTQVTRTNNTTAVDICSFPVAADVCDAPQQRLFREIDTLTFYNADTGAVTGSLLYNENDNTYVIAKVTLASGNTLSYDSKRISDLLINSNNWRVLGATGGELGKFFAVTDRTGAGNHFCLSNDDGVTWEAQTVSDTTVAWQSIAWNGTVFCINGDTDSCMTSTDGITWASHTMPSPFASGGAWKSTARLTAAGLLGATCQSGGVNGMSFAVSSDNGDSWTRLGSDTALGGGPGKVAYSPDLDLYVWVTERNFTQPSARWSSDGGVTWTNSTSGTITTGNYTEVLWIPWLSLFVGGGLGKNIWSSDGKNWTVDTQAGVTQIAVSNDLLVAVGGDNHTYTSTDGKNWTQHSIDGSLVAYTRIAFNGTVFCAVTYAQNGNSATSTDGATWTVRDNQPDDNFRGITAQFSLA